MIVLIDNYDSFTYNLVQYLGDLKAKIKVVRNDAMSALDVLKLKPAGLMISPGPGTPDDSGISLELVTLASEKNIPLLGVCLGHQAIGQAFGGKIVRESPMHGKISEITHTGEGVFAGLGSPLNVTRYHSLVIAPESLPANLRVTAKTSNGVIMGVQHKTKPIHGVQFHPESIASENGRAILKNFTEML